ncbi:MAG: apolipoprotein N-acyltransferase, partial [Polyangiaceae bacterium]
ALAFASGAFFAMDAPPANFIPALWLGMTGLAFSLAQPIEKNPLRTLALRGELFGFGANLVFFRFLPSVVTHFTPLPTVVGLLALIVLAAAQSLRWLVAGALYKLLVERGAPRWVAFPIGVFAGTFAPMVFPWNPATGATPWPVMVQLADVVGERGVTALMALTAALFAEAVLLRDEKRRAQKFAAIAFAIPIATALVGFVRIREIDALRAASPTASIALVQPSVGATMRWDPKKATQILAELEILTKSAENKGAELTVWHEGAYPYVVAHASRRAPYGSAAILGPGVHGPILTGIILSKTPSESTNSAILVQRDNSYAEPYDKIHLLWFGEMVPFADVFPALRRVFIRGTGLVAGDHQVLFVSGKIRAAVLNCFEDILPGAGREAMAVKPNLLIDVTNDAWFAGSIESELHLRMAAMRSVELRRDLVRAVNFGSTSWVDAVGRVRGRYAEPFPGTLMTTPALIEASPTIFARFGEWPAIAMAAIFTAFACRKRKTEKPSVTEVPETK